MRSATRWGHRRGMKLMTRASAGALLFLTTLALATPAAAQPTGIQTCSLEDDSYTVFEGQSLVVDPPGVLGNDDHLLCLGSLEVVAGPTQGGTVVLNGDGGFTFEPAGVGPDVFSYAYVLAGVPQSEPAHVQIGVRTTCTPVAVDDGYETTAGTVLQEPAPGVKANDSTCDGYFVSTQTSPENGTLELNTDGSFQYTPNAGFTGVDSFTYVHLFSWGDPSNEGTVTINVTEPPACEPYATEDTYQTNKGETLVSPYPVTSNDAPCLAGNDVEVLDEPDNGTLTFSSDGNFEYEPDAGWSGIDFFTYGYTGTDVSALVHIDVLCFAVAEGDTYEASQNGVLDVGPPGVLGNDPETCGRGAEELSPPVHGELTLNVDGSFQYTPNPGYIGPDGFEYRITGSPSGFARSWFGSGRGGSPSVAPGGAPSDSHIGEVTINVTEAPTGDAPSCDAVAVDDAYETSQDAALSVDRPGVLANDTTCEGGDYDFPNLESEPSHGTLVFNEAFGTILYTPDAGFTGVDTFEYFLISEDEDDTNNRATVSITVTELPEPDDSTSASPTTAPPTPTTVPTAPTTAPTAAVSGQLPATGSDLVAGVAVAAVAIVSIGSALLLAVGGSGGRRRGQVS